MSLALKKSASLQDRQPFRVMLVDDSAIIRGLLGRILERDPQISVVATAANGEQAIRALKGHDVEVIVLDIEMPVMDGLTALPRILEFNPAVKVIMASTLTQRNAQISLQALASGATDYIPKPSANREINQGDDFHRELCGKVKALGAAYRNEFSPAARPPSKFSATGERARDTVDAKADSIVAGQEIVTRPASGSPAEAIAIGSSTGGPQALLVLLNGFDPTNRLPIFITQHMPPTFTRILAEHITKASGRDCKEATEGEVVAPGRIYLAPGGWHMAVHGEQGKKLVRLNQDPPINFCRPSVDPMFRSLARVYNGHVLGIMLTGMGQDGLEGARAIVEAGGTIIAQDENTSVVWGMPGAVAAAGVCTAVLPLSDLPGYIQKFPKRMAQ